MTERSYVVYLVSANSTNLCKIGYTSNLKKRLSRFNHGHDLNPDIKRKYPKIGFPLSLEVIKSFPTETPKQDEQYLHRLMQSHRAFSYPSSEWFVFPLIAFEDLSWFKSYTSVSAQTNQQIKLDKYLQLLADIGVDIENFHLTSILNQCKDENLLKKAVQLIVDDAAEIHSSYPTEQATHIIYTMTQA